MARHSAPRRTPRRHPVPPARPVGGTAHRTADPARQSRFATSAVLAVSTLTGGALLLGEHPPTAQADVADAAFLVTGASTDQVVSAARVVAPSVEPVDPVPATFDAQALVKAVSMEEEQAEARAAALEQEAREDEERARGCAAGDSGFETVQSQVREVGIDLRCRFGVETVHGVAGRSNASDHPDGLALDLMVDRDPGEELAEYAAANMDELGISYVIYRQQINSGSGWEAMEDRGGETANHMDHVHISFDGR